MKVYSCTLYAVALTASGATTNANDAVCTTSRDLDSFPQWREEVGYWLGDLSFYGPDGEPYKVASWNYPYDNYKGFITGNIAGGSYRQRNVFLYPPQTQIVCETNDSVAGNGTCGTNGNSKNFEADQSIRSDIPVCDGTIEGDGALNGGLDSKTTLVGDDNAVLYQVYFQGALYQSQLTTLSGNGRRTRSAHGYDPFGPTPEIPTSTSYYRERRVEKEEFYETLKSTLDAYGILSEDTCTRDGMGLLLNDGTVGGFDACEAHLEESFALTATTSTGEPAPNGTAPLPTSSPVVSPSPIALDVLNVNTPLPSSSPVISPMPSIGAQDLVSGSKLLRTTAILAHFAGLLCAMFMV